jgi:hypothetical protein
MDDEVSLKRRVLSRDDFERKCIHWIYGIHFFHDYLWFRPPGFDRSVSTLFSTSDALLHLHISNHINEFNGVIKTGFELCRGLQEDLTVDFMPPRELTIGWGTRVCELFANG